LSDACAKPSLKTAVDRGFWVMSVFRFCIESGGKPEIVMYAYNLGHFRLTSIQFRRFAAFFLFELAVFVRFRSLY